jgi:hypothetical protein
MELRNKEERERSENKMIILKEKPSASVKSV